MCQRSDDKLKAKIEVLFILTAERKKSMTKSFELKNGILYLKTNRNNESEQYMVPDFMRK